MAVRGYVFTIAAVRRKDVAEAVEEFPQARQPWQPLAGKTLTVRARRQGRTGRWWTGHSQSGYPHEPFLKT